MKKNNIAAIVAGLFIGTAAFAGTGPAIKAYAPVSWESDNSKQVIKVTMGSNKGSSYNVQIFVSQMSPDIRTGALPVGIVVKNCAGVNDRPLPVDPGSSIMCTLTEENPVISFSSNSDQVAATGTYQIGNGR